MIHEHGRSQRPELSAVGGMLAVAAAPDDDPRQRQGGWTSGVDGGAKGPYYRKGHSEVEPGEGVVAAIGTRLRITISQRRYSSQ